MSVEPLNVEPLPPEVLDLLDKLNAPSQLVAHLALVHDVARTLTARLDAVWPALRYDRWAVWMGAALHDIGKVVHPEELTQPGHGHEVAGETLLREQGFPDVLARFSWTHARWSPGATEDLLVALADHWWRGKRPEPLESTICDWIAEEGHVARWWAFALLDEIAAGVTALADARLAWQWRAAHHGG